MTKYKSKFLYIFILLLVFMIAIIINWIDFLWFADKESFAKVKETKWSNIAGSSRFSGTKQEYPRFINEIKKYGYSEDDFWENDDKAQNITNKLVENIKSFDLKQTKPLKDHKKHFYHIIKLQAKDDSFMFIYFNSKNFSFGNAKSPNRFEYAYPHNLTPQEIKEFFDSTYFNINTSVYNTYKKIKLVTISTRDKKFTLKERDNLSKEQWKQLSHHLFEANKVSTPLKSAPWFTLFIYYEDDTNERINFYRDHNFIQVKNRRNAMWKIENSAEFISLVNDIISP